MKNIKKTVCLTSLVYVTIFGVIYLVTELCNSEWCRVRDDDFIGTFLLTFFSLFPVFIFSLITYKMRKEAFHAWWSFARWWVPIIVVITLLLNNAGGGGNIGMDSSFDFFILDILYGVLVIVSIIRIWRARK